MIFTTGKMSGGGTGRTSIEEVIELINKIK